MRFGHVWKHLPARRCAQRGHLQAAPLFHVSTFEGVACLISYFQLTPPLLSLNTPRLGHGRIPNLLSVFAPTVSLSGLSVGLQSLWVDTAVDGSAGFDVQAATIRTANRFELNIKLPPRVISILFGAELHTIVVRLPRRGIILFGKRTIVQVG